MNGLSEITNAWLLCPLAVTGVLLCVFRAHRWNRQEGVRPPWKPPPSGDAPDFGERVSAAPLLRSDLPAPDADSARLAVRVARYRVHQWQNPWYARGRALGVCLFTAYAAAVWARFGVASGLPVLLALTPIFVYQAFEVIQRHLWLPRARRTLELNQEPTEQARSGGDQP